MIQEFYNAEGFCPALFGLTARLDLRSACLMGSGTLFIEHASVSWMAVSREILLPTDT